MSNLEASERNDFNMRGFCYAYKDFDGSPTNHLEQKDSQEFLSMFMDRLENELKPTSRKYLVKNTFGGKTCS